MNKEKIIDQRLKKLSSIGSDPSGGMTRLLYSDSWLEAQKYVKAQMESFKMTTKFDEVGNLFGRIAGSTFPEETQL